MPRNRVGVEEVKVDKRHESIENEALVAKQVKTSESIERVKAQRQKELLRKKKAERRSHAKQRLIEKERRHEERKQRHENEKMMEQDVAIVDLIPSFEESFFSMELVPKHVTSYPSTEAAAVTIQKALKRQLKKCQWMFRHSPRIFTEQSVAVERLEGSETTRTSPSDDLISLIPVLEIPPLKSCESPRRCSLSSCSSCSCSDEGSSCSCSCSCSWSSSLSESQNMLSLSSDSKVQDQIYTQEHDVMAIRIQARMRGFYGRMQAIRRNFDLDQEIKNEALKEVQEEAIVKIQSRLRGVLVRKHMPFDDRERRRRRKQQDQKIKMNQSLELEPGIYDNLNEIGTWPLEFNAKVQETFDNIATMPFLALEQVRVFCGTWNMHAKKPRNDLRDWIQWQQYHIVAIGSEECVHSIAKSVVFASKKSWEEELKVTLGSDYVLVASHALTAIHNVVFVHMNLVPFLGNIQSDAVATGLGNQLGNKGGVGIAFTLGFTSFAFINCHFEAHQQNVKKRNGNYHRINDELQLCPEVIVPFEEPISSQLVSRNGLQGLGRTSVNRFSMTNFTSSGSKRAVSDLFDRVFWYGDLNYRINGTRRMVDTLLLRNQYEVLYANDQLQREMKAGNVFVHFKEGPLYFRPTYKFDKRSDIYDSSVKQRIPSWTDRVLYLSNHHEQDIELLSYRSQRNFQTSDHRPVCATFQVAFSAKEPIQSPSRKGQLHENTATSQVCSIQ